jgi:hypothetical protein
MRYKSFGLCCSTRRGGSVSGRFVATGLGRVRLVFEWRVECGGICGLNVLFLCDDRQITFHCVCILAVGVVLWFNVVDSNKSPNCWAFDERNAPKTKCCLVEIERRSIGDTHMQTDILAVECLDHCSSRLVHELLGQAKSAVRSFDGQRSDVPVWLLVRIFLP